jgi:hypothetical protein
MSRTVGAEQARHQPGPREARHPLGTRWRCAVNRFRIARQQ